MLMTGLLSLNVHDSLTFEGTELCLHPDLFPTGEILATSGSQQTRSTAHNVKSNNGDDPSKASAGGASTGSGDQTAAGSVGVSVGDMIEIRVWDPLPKRDASSLKNVGNASLRSGSSRSRQPLHGNSPSTTQPIIPSSSFSSSGNGAPSLPSNISDDGVHVEVPNNIQMTPNIRPRTASFGANSLQYSTETEEDNNDASTVTSSKKEDSSTGKESAKTLPVGSTWKSSIIESPGPPTKTVTLSPNNGNETTSPSPTAGNTQPVSHLPPVFPRPRLSSNELVNKPPVIRRGKSAAGAIPTQRSPKPMSRHKRDISDVTIDTHQLDDINNVENHEETTTDDAWSSNGFSKISSTHRLRLSFVLLVTENTLTTLKGNTRTQISMLRQVADLYSLSSYDKVTVHRIEQEDEEEVLNAVSADYVVVSIQDQFISRGDMFYFQRALKGHWIYEGQRLEDDARGIKANASEIRHGNYSAKSGIVTEDTMITFRSKSSRIVWLVQLSCEMWDYSSPYEHSNQEHEVCEIYFDKCINFMSKLFMKWKEMKVTHSLTVVFFSRTFLTNGQKSRFNLRDVYGRNYEDHYKPVIENETDLDWHSLIVRIKEEFIKYPREVGWSFDRRPSNANQGNVLEAINVTLNLMQYHFLDRDLKRSGQSIVVISPGCGVFEVNKGLAEITYQRMMDNGIGSDMLSLGLPPLHIAPFFLYNNEYHAIETTGVDTSETYYEVPHWMHLSFINYDRKSDHQDHHTKPDKNVFEQRKKNGLWMDSYEVASNGFLRPRIDPDAVGTDDSPAIKSKMSKSSFSAIGNAAATPGKAKAARERQLISGRDFRDILEACRPRLSGMKISSSLASVLKLSYKDLTPKAGYDKDVPLREWGAVDFSELAIRSKTKSIKSESPTSLRSPILDVLEKSEDNSESGSNSSSFASHVSSVFGFGYDRILWDQFSVSPGAVSKKTMQLQRSLSFEFEKSAIFTSTDSDAAFSEDSLSLGTSLSSTGRLSSGGDAASATDFEGSEPLLSDNEKRTQNLRRLMEAHDARACAPHGSDKGNLKEVNVSSTSNSDKDLLLSSSRHRGKEVQKGGLGAALSSYDGKGPQQEMHLTRRMSSQGQGLMSSGTRVSSPPFSGMTQINESGTRAISPILLPPIIQLQNMDDTGTDAVQGSQQYSSSSENKVFIGSAGRLPHLSHSEMAVTPLYSIVGPSSLTNYDNGRQKISSTSRSPPLNSDLIIGGTRASKKAIAFSPPTSMIRERPSQRKGRNTSSGQKQTVHSRRKKVFNPFRQSDEDEVLAKRSHNRRRWSHVFPAGEVEFKRHAGPIWISLTSPAILPLSVDYIPSPHELRDETRFQFSPYTVTLGGIEKSFYSSHDELLLEMVRQRVTQDFQIVTASAIEESKTRAESQRQTRSAKSHGRVQAPIPSSRPSKKAEHSGTIKRYLSMGHRIQVMEYDPSSDTIEIVHYNEKSAHNDPMNIYKYQFLLFSKTTENYSKATQTFKKYADPYKWNKVDNLICGEEKPTLEEGMRSRRVMFGLIPESFASVTDEKEYISKFLKLLEYLSKLRDKEDSRDTLNVKIVSSADSTEQKEDEDPTARRGRPKSTVTFTVQLRKGKRDPFEWLELAIDSVFDTTKSYRIMFNWLVASSAKVEDKIQLLQRRCNQYGLNLISFPHTTVSSNLFLHALAVPTLISVKDKDTVKRLDAVLKEKDFIHDGTQSTDANVLECIDKGHEYDFPRYRSGKIKAIPSRQYVHRSGALFVRTIIDRQGWAILAGIENYRHASKENGFREIASQLVKEIAEQITKEH